MLRVVWPPPALLGCLLCSGPALSQVAAPPVRAWTGANGANWNVPANWSGNTVPISSADATINSAGGPVVSDAQAVRILRVGETASGSTLTINGVLTNFSTAFIGDAAGSSGTVNISGAGSAWRANTYFNLQVGVQGTGTLNILDGGNLNNIGSGVLSIASASPASIGLVNVSGGSLNVGQLHVGASGQGTLSIDGGGSVVSGTSNIGNGTAATPLARALLGGAGSSWTTATLTIGNRSDGRLDLSDGATLITNGPAFIANTDARIAQTGSGFANLDGASWSITGNLAVGGVKDGTLQVLNGSTLSANDRFVAGSGNGIGTVLVDASTFTVGRSETVEVGGGSGSGRGAGFMTVRNGSAVTFDVGVLNIAGRANAVPGTLLVEGAGTTLDVAGGISISNTAAGTFTIRDGATVNSGGLGAGGGLQGSATMLVDAATWNLDGLARMGRFGFADLRIQNGGEVNVTGPVELALNPTGNATITLAGTGGTFNAPTLSGGEILTDGTFSPAQGQATLNLDHSNAGQLFPAAILGNFTVNQRGPGTTIFTGDSTFTGSTTISGGTLQLGNGGLTGFIHSDISIAAGGTLALNRGDPTDAPFEVGQDISGPGSLRNIGPGTTILSGANSYTGATDIEAGELLASSMASAQITVYDGARFSAHATGTTLPGAVIVHGGGTLNPVGRLNLGSLLLESGSLLDYRLGVPTNAPGSDNNDRIVVSGNLTLGGTQLDIIDLGGFGQGVYRIFDYGGTLTGGPADLVLGTFPAGLNSADFTVQTAINGQVNLVVSAGGLANQWWDGTQTTDNATIDGGDGVWRLDVSNWTNAQGAVNATWAPGFAIFAGQAGIATLEQDIPVGGMQFITDGYRIEPGGFVLRGDPDTTVKVDQAVTATIVAPLTDGTGGAAELIKSGFGTLVLEGTNTYGGGTRIVTGTVRVAADANLGAAGALTFENGVLNNTASFATARPVTLERRGVFRTDANTTLTVNAVIGGAGELIKQDAGTLALTGSNQYSGGTTVASGTLVIGADAALGDPNGSLVLGGEARVLHFADALGMFGGHATGAGGTLQLSADVELSPGRLVRLDEPGGIVDTNGFDGILRQGIVGAGSLTKAGAGTLILTGDNRFTGGTTIAGGTLQLGDGTVASSVVGHIENAGTLAFNFSGGLTYDGTISGSGALLKSGTGTLILTADQPYTGGTTIEGGTLQLGNGESSGNLSGGVVNDGLLVFDRADSVSFPGVISGAGAVEQSGSGTLVFTAANTYAGGTNLRDGILQVATDAALGDPSGGLTFDGGALRLGAAFDPASSRGITLNSGGGSLDTNGFDTEWQQSIAGDGSLRKFGAGTLSLSGTSSYQGPTTINAGGLHVDGSLLSAVLIEEPARLSGNGSVGDLTNYGQVAPGASIGALTVNGDFLQGGTGRLEIEFNDRGDFDRLLVSGAATLEGAVEYLPDPTSVFGEDLLYTYLPAPGGVAGTFIASASEERAGVRFETLYNPDSVQLRITSKPLPDNIVTPSDGGANLASCLASLDAQRRNGALGANGRLALRALVDTTVSDFLTAAIDTCPRDTSVLPQAVHGLTMNRAGTISARIAQVHDAVEAPQSAGMFDAYRLRDGVDLWIKGVYQDGAGDARDLVRQGFDSHARGFMLGVDAEFAESGVVGGYLAHDDLDIDYRGTQGDTAGAQSSAWTAGLYGSYWSQRRWFVQGSAGYGWHDVETRRDIRLTSFSEQATGERDARNLAAALGGGYNASAGHGWLIQPQIQVSYDRFEDDAHTETGAGALNLDMTAQHADTLRGEAGLVVRKSLFEPATRPDIGVLYLYAHYVHDQALDDRSRGARFAISSPFEVRDTEETRQGIRYGLGFENTWHNNTAVQLLIEAEDYGEIETLSGSLQFRKQL